VLALLLVLRAASAQEVQPPMQTVVVTGKRPQLDVGITPYGVLSVGAPATATVTRSLPMADQNSDTTSCRVSPQTPHPVVIATGEKYVVQNDFAHYAYHDLSLSRKYRSQQTSGRLFGKRWNSSLDYPKLEIATTYHNFGYASMADWIKVRLPDGTVRSYAVGGYGYYMPAGIPDGYSVAGMIVAAPNNAWMLKLDGKEYLYSAVSKNILSIKEGGQILYTFNYVGDQLQSIVSRAGGSVGFSWQNNRVTAVTAPDGHVWSYAYDGLGNLTTVTPPSSAIGIRTYHYEDPIDNSLLTGYSIDGVRATRYAYGTLGRVLKSGFDNNEAFETFEYSSNYTYTIVRNESGAETRYDFQVAANAQKLIKATGAATTSCAASLSSNGYATNGFLSYSLDKNGNKTTYSYAGNGLLLTTTEGFGTSSAHTETNTWINGKLSRKIHSNASAQQYLQEDYGYVAGGLADGWPLSMKTTDLRTAVQHTTTYAYTFHPNNSPATVTSTKTLPGGPVQSVRSFNTNGMLGVRAECPGSHNYLRAA
jgi:YD repeat-containing protein